MPERIEKLKATISELESELESLESIDPETRDVLEEAMQDIQTALDKDVDQLEHDSLATRLKEAAEEFESSHPTLFGVVTRMIDTLGQMGI